MEKATHGGTSIKGIGSWIRTRKILTPISWGHEEPISPSALHSHRHRSRLLLGGEDAPPLFLCHSQQQSKQKPPQQCTQEKTTLTVLCLRNTGQEEPENQTGALFTLSFTSSAQKRFYGPAGSSQETGPWTALLGQALMGGI